MFTWNPSTTATSDRYYTEFKAKRDIVKVKQSRLHAVRGWIATTIDPNVHKIAIRDIRNKLDRRPADDDADETDEISVRELVVYLRDKFAPNATNIRTGILKKYNQHLEEAKRANTSFDTWIAQWNVLYHKAISADVGDLRTRLFRPRRHQLGVDLISFESPEWRSCARSGGWWWRSILERRAVDFA
ncbi:hypothetical protein E4U52_003925 [Claviceps spartinae]|nr:hypothetical protein E4U52_003925 [Claviceps spartinae]